MADNLLKTGLESEKTRQETVPASLKEEKVLPEVKDTTKTVIEGVETVGGAEEEGGQFGEKQEEDSGQSRFAVSSAKSARSGQTTITSVPPIDEMIRQTVEAINMELKQTKEEVNRLISKKASPYDINAKVMKIRFLNNLLSELKRAAKLAEEYVVNLWKQYVKKSG